MLGGYDVLVIGGGPAGSVAARSIAAAGYTVALMEKQSFPRETLCGEFLSAEVIRAISEMGLDREFKALHPNPLRTFTLLPEKRSPVGASLGFTAYGVRRGVFDSMLLEAARQTGVTVIQPAEVSAIQRDHQGFTVRYRYKRDERTSRGQWVIGAFGRNSTLDKRLGRAFARTRTGFNGFKYHVPAEMIENLRDDQIAIALGPMIYCGIARVSDNTVTMCALEYRKKGDVSTREKIRALARANPSFGRLLRPAVLDILPGLPVYGTGDLFFGHRDVVVNGILMVGDSAGIIAPLAGDGIGIAMDQGRLLGRLFVELQPRPCELERFSHMYRRESEKLFRHRKRVALLCQRIALSKTMRPAVAPLLSSAPGLLRAAIEATRGNIDNHYVAR